MRILLDANIWVSGAISRKMRDRLKILIGRADIILISSNELLTEIEDTLARPKLAKYITPEKVEAYVQIIRDRVDIIESESVVELCRDSHDDYLLALCQDGKVDYFITGDKDLLVHNPFGNTRIIMLTDFEEILRQ